MSAPRFNILTAEPVVIDLSRPALHFIEAAISEWQDAVGKDDSIECEVDNFRNLLLNLLERSEPGNLDLIGG